MFYKSIAPANHTDNQTAKIKNIFLIIHTKSSHAMKMFLMTQTVSVIKVLKSTIYVCKNATFAINYIQVLYGEFQ